jgi:hypothetical protein
MSPLVRMIVAFALLVLPCGRDVVAQDYAPLPESLTAARSAYLVNVSGDPKAFDKFYQELRKWNRFTLAPNRQSADVTMELSTVADSQVIAGGAYTSGGVTSGTAVAAPIEKLPLRILAGEEVLWTDQTDKWMTSGHAPAKLVSNLRKRMPKRQEAMPTVL